MSIDSDLTMLRLAARVDPVLRDALTRVEAEIARLREQAETLAEALELTLRFVPPWAEAVPEGLDATFYGTLTMKGDLKVKGQVDGARAALRAYRAYGGGR